MFFVKGNPTNTGTTLRASKASSAHEQTIVHGQVTATDVMIPNSAHSLSFLLVEWF